MDGSSRVFPVDGEITLGGKAYKCKARFNKDYAEIEAHLLQLRPDPRVETRAMVEMYADNPVMQEAALRIGMEQCCKLRYITRYELYDWIQNTVPGCAFAVWLAVRDDPDAKADGLNLDKVQELMLAEIEDAVAQADAESVDAVTKAVLESYHDPINQAGGEDWRGNSTGSPPTPSQEVSEPETSTSRSTGG
jgi:hypothetical protein